MHTALIEYIPLQQGLRHTPLALTNEPANLIEYIPLQQGLRLLKFRNEWTIVLIEYIPLQQGLRRNFWLLKCTCFYSLSIFHYNKD